MIRTPLFNPLSQTWARPEYLSLEVFPGQESIPVSMVWSPPPPTSHLLIEVECHSLGWYDNHYGCGGRFVSIRSNMHEISRGRSINCVCCRSRRTGQSPLGCDASSWTSVMNASGGRINCFQPFPNKAKENIL